MYFENYYIHYSENLQINSIYEYKNIMSKFIIKYIEKNKINYTKNNIYLDASMYSKYYLYWKIYNCIYDDSIMNILYETEY